MFERALAETSSDNEPKMVHFGDLRLILRRKLGGKNLSLVVFCTVIYIDFLKTLFE